MKLSQINNLSAMKLGTYIRVMKTVLCSKCGEPHRATRNDAICKACHAQRRAIWAKQHPEKVAAKKVKYLATPKGIAKTKEYSALSKVKEYNHKWFAEHPELRCAYSANRRASELQATPLWANLDHIAGMYELCGLFRRIGLDWEVDHIIPLQGKRVSGFHVEDNLQIIPSVINAKKSNHFVI